MATTRTARVIQFAEIEQRFELAPLRWGNGSPAVGQGSRDGYFIRVLVYSSRNIGGNTTEKYDYFRCDAEGTITEAPRGYARDYKPGRVPVEELDAAVAKYAETQ